jgi:transglutaminase superfamily protein
MRAREASGDGELKQSPHGLRLSQLWVAVRVGLWLCTLPIRMRMRSLPSLLHQLTPVRRHVSRRGPLELEQAVRIVRRICRLRCFRGPRFPQACLRQALALYHLLSQLGYPVAIHFGVSKDGEALRGHSWVTVDGQPLAERLSPEALHTIYSFPATASYASQERPRAGKQHSM